MTGCDNWLIFLSKTCSHPIKSPVNDPGPDIQSHLCDVPSLNKHSNGIISLIHWGRETHICVDEYANIGSDNGLSPNRRQTIIWTNVGILLIEPLWTNFNETLIEIHTFSFRKMHLKMSSGKSRPFCLGLNVLIKVIHPAFPSDSFAYPTEINMAS